MERAGHAAGFISGRRRRRGISFREVAAAGRVFTTTKEMYIFNACSVMRLSRERLVNSESSCCLNMDYRWWKNLNSRTRLTDMTYANLKGFCCITRRKLRICGLVASGADMRTESCNQCGKKMPEKEMIYDSFEDKYFCNEECRQAFLNGSE